MPPGTFVDRVTTEMMEGDVVTIRRGVAPDPEEDGDSEFCVMLARENEEYGGPKGQLVKTQYLSAKSLTPGALAKAIERCSWGITDAIDTIRAAQE